MILINISLHDMEKVTIFKKTCNIELILVHVKSVNHD